MCDSLASGSILKPNRPKLTFVGSLLLLPMSSINLPLDIKLSLFVSSKAFKTSKLSNWRSFQLNTFEMLSFSNVAVDINENSEDTRSATCFFLLKLVTLSLTDDVD